MKNLSLHLSQEIGAAFAGSLKHSRKLIGSVPFQHKGSNYGVGGNTFRAYTGYALPPSGTYRALAEAICSELDVRALSKQLSTARGFQTWHASLGDSLQEHWTDQQGDPLSFAHQYKLIDLFVKWLSKHNFESTKLSEAFVAHANCALDSQTLRMLNEGLSLALPISKPSMGDVHSKITYGFCQDLIAEFAAHFGGTRLLFDYFAWEPGGAK